MKLDMIGIIVGDMNQAIAFYKTLGFEPTDVVMNDYVELNNSSIRISLNTKSMIEGIYGFKPQSIGERIELAFLCHDAEELDTIVNRIKSKGYTVLKNLGMHFGDSIMLLWKIQMETI